MSRHSPASAEDSVEYRTRIDGMDPEVLQRAVVEAVAAAAGVEPTDLDPLYGAVDPDALSRLFWDSGGLRDVSFAYAGYHVRVFADGEVVVRSAV